MICFCTKAFQAGKTPRSNWAGALIFAPFTMPCYRMVLCHYRFLSSDSLCTSLFETKILQDQTEQVDDDWHLSFSSPPVRSISRGTAEGATFSSNAVGRRRRFLRPRLGRPTAQSGSGDRTKTCLLWNNLPTAFIASVCCLLPIAATVPSWAHYLQ